jgi:hypothetical protein
MMTKTQKKQDHRNFIVAVDKNWNKAVYLTYVQKINRRICGSLLKYTTRISITTMTAYRNLFGLVNK